MRETPRRYIAWLVAVTQLAAPFGALAGSFEYKKIVPLLAVQVPATGSGSSGASTSGSTAGSTSSTGSGASTGSPSTTGGTAGTGDTGSTTGTTGTAGTTNPTGTGTGSGATTPAAPVGVPALSAGGISFGNVNLNLTSATQTLLLLNQGTATLSLTSAPSTSGDFAVTTNCGATLAAGTSCQLNIVFRPTTAGVLTGALDVGTSAGAVSAVLAGVGFVPMARSAWASTSLAFGGVMAGSSSMKSMLLYNDGNIHADFSTLTGLSTGVSADASACVDVAPGAHCSVNFSYAPTQAAAYEATGIAPSAGTPNNSLTITGLGLQTHIGLSTGSLSFGGQMANTTSTALAVAVLNTGNLETSIDALTVTGPFAATTDCGSTLAGGSQCAVNVTFTPVAGSEGAGNSGTITLGTGVGAQTINLTGTTWRPLTAALSGGFYFTTTPSGALASATLGSYTDVTYYVKATGHSGALNTSATFSGSSDFQVRSVQKMYAYGYDPGGLVYYYNQLAACGATAVTGGLANCISDGLNTSATFVDMVVTVRFTPSSVGTKAATLYIGHNASNASPMSLDLSATGLGVAQATLNTTAVSYADTTVGSSSTQTVRLTNGGTAALVLSGTPSVPDNAQYTVAAGGTTCSSSLAAGSYCDTTVKFTPTAGATATGTLTFVTSVGNVTATLTGKGLQAAISASASALSFTGSALNTASPAQVVTVTNSGNGPMTTGFPATLTGTDAARYAVTGTCQSLTASTLAAGASCTASVTFTPTDTATRTATLNVGGKTATLSGLGINATAGQIATSCQSIKTATPSSASGVYTLSRVLGGVTSNFNAYCDMTTDGGGWMLVLYGSFDANTKATVRTQDLVIQGYPLATRSENPATYPAAPTGLLNNFSQVLFIGGTTTWTNKMGAWQHASTYPYSTTSVASVFSGVATGSGLTAMYGYNRGWGGTTMLVTDPVHLWDANGVSPLCGGANTPGGRNCPYSAYINYSYHYDNLSVRSVYVR